ncbi:(3S,6E)-nerolidol synthase 1-like [Aristolochia californica]|uniref:(3S,6E)-nerolidol synthase 1-like n=1 Tax=Aristolochia californica TaxID=171875 RepID=UPI0035DBFF04
METLSSEAAGSVSAEEMHSVIHLFTSTPFTNNMEDLQTKRLKAVEEVRRLLLPQHEPVESAVLIDKLQRLGIDYHFRDEIEQLLPLIHDNVGDDDAHHGLLFAALSFRLLRQCGYYVSTSVFNRFRDRDGRFKTQLSEDIAGMLALYEASFLSLEGEDMLDEARKFSSSYLRKLVGDVEASISGQIEYILNHPFYLSIPRFNIKHYLEKSTGAGGKNEIVNELAKLDFNIVQLMLQRELQEVARWWRSLGLQKELKLARENYVEWFIWSLIVASDPQLSTSRVEMAKPIAFIFLIDDIFDVYGTLDELIIFTEAVERWEVESTKMLPRFMKMSFMALYNTTNDIAGKVHKQQVFYILQWAAMCRSFLAEKRWLSSGNLPESEVYLRNGMISSGVPMALIHMFVLLGEGKKKEKTNLLRSIPDLISHSAMIFRLWNDMKSVNGDKGRGHDGSYADCYMKERCGTFLSIESVEEHVKQRLNVAWKKLNAECLSANPYAAAFTTASLNVPRMAQMAYSYNDDERPVALKELSLSLLMESVPL